MEEELGRRETGEIGVLDEPLGFGAVIVFDEVRQRAVAKAKRNTLTLHVLLTHAGNNLKWRMKCKVKWRMK